MRVVRVGEVWSRCAASGGASGVWFVVGSRLQWAGSGERHHGASDARGRGARLLPGLAQRTAAKRQTKRLEASGH